MRSLPVIIRRVQCGLFITVEEEEELSRYIEMCKKDNSRFLDTVGCIFMLCLFFISYIY